MGKVLRSTIDHLKDIFTSFFKKEQKHFYLKIGPVISRAEEIKGEILKELPEHKGLIRIAKEVCKAAVKSKNVSHRMNSIFALHKIPVYLLVLTLAFTVYWIYTEFFYTSSVRFAIPERDTQDIRQKLKVRIHLNFIQTIGSQENLKFIKENKADICFIQGGIDIPEDYNRVLLKYKEVALFMVHKGITKFSEIKTVCTSVKNQGSHTFAGKSFTVLGRKDIKFIHCWKDLTDNPDFVFPKEIDAVLVVKNIGEEKNLNALKKLQKLGFKIRELDLGAWGSSRNYLKRIRLRPGFLFLYPLMPQSHTYTYEVSSYLVAPPKFSIQKLRMIASLLQPKENISNEEEDTIFNRFLQRADSFSQVLVSIALVIISFVSFGIFAFRKRFNELNTLISLINIHQATKDLYDETDSDLRRKYRTYLAYCSDLLGIIDVITGYYAQENSSLLFNGFCGIIHQRCSNLKINIQLKIQHATLKYHRMAAYKDKSTAN